MESAAASQNLGVAKRNSSTHQMGIDEILRSLHGKHWTAVPVNWWLIT
jgi:hypothetical protein